MDHLSHQQYDKIPDRIGLRESSLFFSFVCKFIYVHIFIVVIFPIVTSGAALIYAGAAVGTSILPTVAAGVLGVLGIGMNLRCACFPIK